MRQALAPLARKTLERPEHMTPEELSRISTFHRLLVIHDPKQVSRNAEAIALLQAWLDENGTLVEAEQARDLEATLVSLDEDRK